MVVWRHRRLMNVVRRLAHRGCSSPRHRALHNALLAAPTTACTRSRRYSMNVSRGYVRWGPPTMFPNPHRPHSNPPRFAQHGHPCSGAGASRCPCRVGAPRVDKTPDQQPHQQAFVRPVGESPHPTGKPAGGVEPPYDLRGRSVVLCTQLDT